MPADVIDKIIDALLADLEPLIFAPPVSHTYNPLVYARTSHVHYWNSYGRPPKKVVLLGMNPGPWGMAQTGVPFGDVSMVKDWLNIDAVVAAPENEHPKRPIQGFGCTRREVSGTRLWGWAKDRYKTPERFFKSFWVANYCPLVFMEESGRNRTPDKLTRSDKKPLFDACDNALRRTVEYLKPRYVIGVGNFAAQRAQHALKDLDVTLGRIIHPSPANPKANQGWQLFAEKELRAIGAI